MNTISLIAFTEASASECEIHLFKDFLINKYKYTLHINLINYHLLQTYNIF